MKSSINRYKYGTIFVAAIAALGVGVLILLALSSANFQDGEDDAVETVPRIILEQGDQQFSGELLGYVFGREPIFELPTPNIENYTSISSQNVIQLDKDTPIRISALGEPAPDAEMNSLSGNLYTVNSEPIAVLDSNHSIGSNEYDVSTLRGGQTYLMIAVATWLPEPGEAVSGYSIYGFRIEIRESPTDAIPTPGTLFTIDVSGERFKVRVTDAATITNMFDNYYNRNDMHVTGLLAKGSGGFNEPWSWHLMHDTVRMVEVSIELCDGRPGSVEEDLEYWLNTVETYCPWSSKVVRVGS